MVVKDGFANIATVVGLKPNPVEKDLVKKAPAHPLWGGGIKVKSLAMQGQRDLYEGF
jgi:hypothetical protein